MFLAFLGATFVALMAALPIVYAQTEQQKPPAGQGATAPASSLPVAPPPPNEHPGFDQADRNKDGFLDKSESGVVPGLSANFERADLNKDGKLDRAEFDKGLEILQVRR